MAAEQLDNNMEADSIRKQQAAEDAILGAMQRLHPDAFTRLANEAQALDEAIDQPGFILAGLHDIDPSAYELLSEEALDAAQTAPSTQLEKEYATSACNLEVAEIARARRDGRRARALRQRREAVN